MSPQSKYWGTCPPCPIGIDAPDAKNGVGDYDCLKARMYKKF